LGAGQVVAELRVLVQVAAKLDGPRELGSSVGEQVRAGAHRRNLVIGGVVVGDRQGVIDALQPGLEVGR
jgi:hypothetical protein